jgi:magnesium-transporting ATPase (P-type)
MGFEVHARAGGQVRLRVTDPGQMSSAFEDFQQVLLIDFNSKRKSMTVVVQRLQPESQAPCGPLIVYTKGADSAVLALLADDSEAATESTRRVVQQCHEYSCESLRCLLVARGELDREEWEGEQGLKAQYEQAQRSQGAAEKGHVEGLCSDLCVMCNAERAVVRAAHLQLIGATAIEDQLQDGVPGCLKTLMAAGINVWVLTGDNVPTAINIGIACDLLDVQMEQEGRLFIFDGKKGQPMTVPALKQKISDCERVIESTLNRDSGAMFGVALHGEVWKLLCRSVPQNSELLDAFFAMTAKCRSVIACRLEPKEKANIVELVRERTGLTCLAIGDGNNDTPMIKAADIGVGIKGVEGASAVAASDYALGQFRLLSRLLLVYGHYNYRGIAYLVHTNTHMRAHTCTCTCTCTHTYIHTHTHTCTCTCTHTHAHTHAHMHTHMHTHTCTHTAGRLTIYSTRRP